MATRLKIDVQPTIVDLLLYSGDGVSIRFICTQGETPSPLDMSGAVQAKIRVNREDVDPPVAEFTADMTDAVDGIVFISLTGDETKDLTDHVSAENGKFRGVWDVQWIPTGSEPRTIVQGTVECVIDVTR